MGTSTNLCSFVARKRSWYTSYYQDKKHPNPETATGKPMDPTGRIATAAHPIQAILNPNGKIIIIPKRSITKFHSWENTIKTEISKYSWAIKTWTKNDINLYFQTTTNIMTKTFLIQSSQLLVILRIYMTKLSYSFALLRFESLRLWLAAIGEYSSFITSYEGLLPRGIRYC